MPGAIYGQNNPFEMYMQYNPQGSQADYNAQTAKGYNFVGGANPWQWSGTQSTNPGGQGYSIPDELKPPWMAKGQPTAGPAGPGGAGGSSFSFGSSFGGKNPFATDAAAAKLRDEFARMRKRTGGAINEDVSNRGIFSSGVAGGMMNDAMTQLDLQEGAGLESLFNNAAQQQLAFQLEMERMRQQGMGAGSQRFSGADTGGNQNQQLMNYYSSKNKGHGSAPGYQTGPLGQMFGPMAGGMGAGMPDTTGLGTGAGGYGGGYTMPGGWQDSTWRPQPLPGTTPMSEEDFLNPAMW